MDKEKDCDFSWSRWVRVNDVYFIRWNLDHEGYLCVFEIGHTKDAIRIFRYKVEIQKVEEQKEEDMIIIARGMTDFTGCTHFNTVGINSFIFSNPKDIKLIVEVMDRVRRLMI